MVLASASKANELPFLRGDNPMALFINPCQYSTYVNPPLWKRPSREKPYFQTNLTLGVIDKMGKLRPGTFRAPKLPTETAVLTFEYPIARPVARRTDPPGVKTDMSLPRGTDGYMRTWKPDPVDARLCSNGVKPPRLRPGIIVVTGRCGYTVGWLGRRMRIWLCLEATFSVAPGPLAEGRVVLAHRDRSSSGALRDRHQSDKFLSADR